MDTIGNGDPLITFVASLVFWIAAISSILAAAALVFRVSNLVRAALALTAVLGSVAALYGILGADFLAMVQLVVYVGAIMVLMIFAIFMTPGQVDQPGTVGRGQQLGAFLVAAVVAIVSIAVVTTNPWNERATPLNIPTTVNPIGELLLSRYVLPFEVASLLLTVALIGAIVIARED
jgi:NADH:ubiquinone oxidoreductase subunit 6 (subunit J)